MMVNCWNIETGEKLFTMAKHISNNGLLLKKNYMFMNEDEVFSVQLGYKGNVLVSGGDNSLIVTNFESKNVQLTINSAHNGISYLPIVAK